MNYNDEELQKRVELGFDAKADGPDAKIYGDIFRNLSRAPKVNIPSNFADKVLVKVIAQKAQRTTLDFVWLGVGAFTLLIVCVIGFSYSGIKIEMDGFKQLAGIVGLVTFAIIFCLLLNILDKKMVTGKFESN